MEKELRGYLEDECGYSEVKEIDGRGIVGVKRFIFTTGLVYGIDKFGYVGRYCYPSMSDAIRALSKWDGTEDPTGDWIKHKGKIEYSNPNREKS